MLFVRRHLANLAVCIVASACGICSSRLLRADIAGHVEGFVANSETIEQ